MKLFGINKNKIPKWKMYRELPPRNIYLYNERLISTKKVDRYLNRITFESDVDNVVSSIRNFVTNLFKKNKEN
jgi:hypothetical protein